MGASLNHYCSFIVPLIPTKVGTQGYAHRTKPPWIPACAGMSG